MNHNAIIKRWKARLVIRRGLEKAARRRFIWHPTARNKTILLRRRAQVAEAEKVIARHRKLRDADSLQERAYQQAVRLVGITEQGGNNRGPEVDALIKEGGGTPGQAWCGWFCAVVYRRAGSKAVTWKWGAVRLYLPLSGLARIRKPKRGDLVRFTFDHIGMFIAFNADGTITTIEGNTGDVGAVSDSKTGGDGVKVKVRHPSLVRDFIRVSR